MSAGRLVGIGVGPGDPEHLTLKALRELGAADRVFVPGTDSTSGGPGRAEAVVAPHVAPERVARLGFAMRDEARRADSWDRAGAAIAEVVRDGGTAAFATIGDPNLYSTFVYVARSVRALVPGVDVETVPGITALQDLAARSGTVLAEGDERLALVPWPAGEERLREALDGFDCVVVYKGGRHLPDVAHRLATHGRGDGAVVGEMLGLPGGRSVAVDAVADRPASYLVTIVVPARRDPTEAAS
jgi:precorrin-2/cobalt-factor-2 C20-methyltransferase